MKHVVYLLGLLIVASCQNSKSNSSVMVEEIPEEKPLKIVQMTSDIDIPSLSFNELEPLLNKATDTTYVVNFWATWCRPCIKEMPYFEKLNDEYSKENVKVILVSLDFPEKLEKQVKPFIKKYNIKSYVVHLNDDNVNNWIPRVSLEWSGAIPATLIYNNESRQFYERSFTYEALETELQTMLKN